VVGRYTPGFVADAELADQLAEIGVILLMFGVGLQFHLDELLAVKGVAAPGAIVQIAAATGLGRQKQNRHSHSGGRRGGDDD
jgi:monovalent cation:H+ antiporter-2, CPA2 family